MSGLEPLEVWFDDAAGEELPTPPALAALYGPLRLAARTDRPHVFTNFVSSVDGVVAIDPPRGTGGDRRGRDAHHRWVLALRRAGGGAVVVGGGTLRAERQHLTAPERLAGELAAGCRALRAALGLPAQPLQLVITGGGDVDLG